MRDQGSSGSGVQEENWTQAQNVGLGGGGLHKKGESHFHAKDTVTIDSDTATQRMQTSRFTL